MRRASDDTFRPAGLSAAAPWQCRCSSQDVIASLEPLVMASRQTRLREVLARRLASVTLLMDAPHDPHNGAAVMRSCDAFGVQELHVIPRHEAFLASNLVAKGAERWVDVIEHPSPQHAAKALRARGFELLTTHPEGDLTPEDLPQLPRVALVLGNERDGIGDDLKGMAQRSVRIPMVGFVESLNVSVSAAILLRAATHGRPGDLGEAEYRNLYARALFYSVRRADEILAALYPA